MLDAHPGVGWVQLPWAGVDAFAGVLRRFAGDGRVWTSAKGAYAQPVAEHALMLALAVLREVPRRVRAGRWEVDERGRSLYGADVVDRGRRRHRRRSSCACCSRSASVPRSCGGAMHPVAGAARTVTVAGLHDALAGAEVVFVAAALTERVPRSHRRSGARADAAGRRCS